MISNPVNKKKAKINLSWPTQLNHVVMVIDLVIFLFVFAL